MWGRSLIASAEASIARVGSRIRSQGRRSAGLVRKGGRVLVKVVEVWRGKYQTSTNNLQVMRVGAEAERASKEERGGEPSLRKR